MSCQGSTVGGKLEELHMIIDAVKDKSRVGVCLDTCHAFAAGMESECFLNLIFYLNSQIRTGCSITFYVLDLIYFKTIHKTNIVQKHILYYYYTHTDRDAKHCHKVRNSLNRTENSIRIPSLSYKREINLIFYCF